MIGDRKPYKVRQSPFDFGWEIADLRDVEHGTPIRDIPKEKIKHLNFEEVVALLEVVAKTELINKVLAGRTYDKGAE